jgi:hypothetical protein
MPNRIIWEKVRSSPNLARVSAEAERLFYRLLTVADDYGRFDADPPVIHSLCFMCEPLKSQIAAQSVRKWLSELCVHRLIRRYRVAGRWYGCFLAWESYQRKRDSKPKFPAPPPQPAATRGEVRRLAASRGNVPPSREPLAVSREARAVSREGRGESPPDREPLLAVQPQKGEGMTTWLSRLGGQPA